MFNFGKKSMELSPLQALSPLDGRYWSKVQELSPYFSEAAYFKYRTQVEIEYFIALCELPLPPLKSVDTDLYPKLREVYKAFSTADAQMIKEIEAETNHDVKAVEYFVKQKLEAFQLGDLIEFVHFGLTSQDINNTALPLAWKAALQNMYFPLLNDLEQQLGSLRKEWTSVPMLARTHGQPARDGGDGRHGGPRRR
jgi:adenylosuccinate lyase